MRNRRLVAGLVGAALMAMTAFPASSQDSNVAALQKLADANNPEALYFLGMSFHLGIGVPQDHAKAFRLFERATKLGDPLAAYKLGCYFDGQGAGVVATDVARALDYKLIAAKAGYALAEQDVAGLLADSGRIAESIPWLERAAAQGWPDSLFSYAAINNGYADIPPDRIKAAAYFRLYERARPTHLPEHDAVERTLTDTERAAVQQLVDAYRPKPTALTLKGLSGQRAAMALIERARRGS